MTVEQEVIKIATYLKIQVKGKISYTEDNIIQLQIDGKVLVGFSTILNHFHNKIEKDNKTPEFFLRKQWFDFSNLFIRSSCKRDKCKEQFKVKYNHVSLILIIFQMPLVKNSIPISKHAPTSSDKSYHLQIWLFSMQLATS